jgi:glycosyltransferase involved in cell wall biosynthesis
VKKIAIITTHPIQYNAPWFKLLSQKEGISLKVFYTWSQSESGAKYDPDFKRVIQWDLPLLDGYEYEFVPNEAKDPGSHHYKGIDNPTLNRAIEQWNPDALLVIGWAYKSHLSCMKYFKGRVPVLFRGDSTLLDEQFGWKQLARRFFLKYVYSFADYALPVGVNNKNYFLAHGLKERQLVYAPHAIDNSRFGNDVGGFSAKAKEWRESLGISDSQFVILFAGKLEPKKNPFFLLELAGHLPSDQFRFILVGNGPLENELKEKAAGDKRIIFIDFQNQQTMPVVYHLADVFILPSNGPGETWGLAVNEAMACGKPVIVSDKAGCAEDLVKPAVNGYVFKTRTGTGEIVTRLKEMAGDKKKSLEMGRASTEIIRSFSFENIVEKVSRLVQDLK